MEHTFLVLADGTIFSGYGFGKLAPRPSALEQEKPVGELVFNTSMTGYQEILSDPSYNGQMIVMTYPHIGNYGCEDSFDETNGERTTVPATAMIVHRLHDGPIPAGRVSLSSYMEKHEAYGITGVDTRKLTLHLRDHGSCNALLVRSEHPSLSDGELDTVRSVLGSFPSICERDLIDGVSVKEVVKDPKTDVDVPADPVIRFALVDFGIKKSIIRELYRRGAAVTLFPPSATAEDILGSGCRALFLSNGPGDPALLADAVKMTAQVTTKMPVCGICLGHQIIVWALGGKTVKMKFGHHGANHPVRDCETGKTFVTSQNHGFMADPEQMPENTRPWFVNANDGSNEGLLHETLPVLSVQFHPEASPGPHDGAWIFDRFIAVATEGETK
jgi:carbamoyl-phosphate synthase small subunit